MNFNIEDVVIDQASVTLDFPEASGAAITIARIPAETVTAIREKSIIGKVLNQSSKQFEDKLDDDKFLKQYSDVVILGWTGLKGKHLKSLILCVIPSDKLEDEVECNAANKYILMKKSTILDGFISATLQSVSLFNQELDKEDTKKQNAG